MRIIDQQLPLVLAVWFQDQGLDAVHVRDLGLSASGDAEIWAEASRDDAVIVSRDEDFVALVRKGAARLVWVRIGNCTNPALIAAITASWPDIRSRLQQGERLVELRA